jgi:hypothetical protein
MLADLLHTLAEDVRRLLHAGALAAAYDEGLRRRLVALRPLAERAPALAALGAAVERVASGGEGRAANALLDLLVLLRLVRAQLTTAGPEGELVDVPASGPWSTPAPAPDLYALYALDGRGHRLDEMRCGALQEVSERGSAADLRHVSPFLDLLTRGYGPMAELLLREVLPFYGRALLPDLRAVMHRHPCLLLAELRLGGLGPDEAVSRLIELLSADREEVRRAAVEALGRVGPPARAAVPALRQLANRWGQRGTQLLAMDALRSITRREGGGQA